VLHLNFIFPIAANAYTYIYRYTYTQFKDRRDRDCVKCSRSFKDQACTRQNMTVHTHIKDAGERG
jgi:hypothetical protein